MSSRGGKSAEKELDRGQKGEGVLGAPSVDAEVKGEAVKKREGGG